MTQMSLADYGIQAREYGDVPSLECRSDSEKALDKNKRYREIMAILGNNFMTAREVAHEMFLRGLIPTDERNYSQPRLNEMCSKGMVEQAGKTKCKFTGKTVTVYRRYEA